MPKAKRSATPKPAVTTTAPAVLSTAPATDLTMTAGAVLKPADVPQLKAPTATMRARPESITMPFPYGVYDDAGNLRSWSAGQVVTDPADIDLLVEHKLHAQA